MSSTCTACHGSGNYEIEQDEDRATIIVTCEHCNGTGTGRVFPFDDETPEEVER